MDKNKLLFRTRDAQALLIPVLITIGVAILIATLLLAYISANNIGPIMQKFGKEKQDKIAVIYIEGTMVADKSTDSDSTACSNDIVRKLRAATDDLDVKAIVLRVNSPGGTPVAAEEIISQIKKTKKVKPVVVSMGDLATSAAYYVSSSADKIVANPDTFTGSIGVVWVFKNRTKYYNEEGITFYIAKSGNYKDIGADWRGLSDGEKDYVQDIVNESYERFIANVADGRNMELENIKKIADGRIYTGCKAKELGLVDELGGLYDAISLAQQLAHVKGKTMIVHMNEPSSKK